MALLKGGKSVDDAWQRIDGDEVLPETGPVVVDLSRWQQDRESLIARADAVGVRLQSDDDPESLAGDLDHLTLHGHEGDSKDVVRRHPILQAVRPA